MASLITYPYEVRLPVATNGSVANDGSSKGVRTRLRQAPSASGPKYTGLVQSFRLIRMEEGMGGLYGGLTPHLMRSIPSAIISLGVYEFVLEAFGKA
ncbi:MC/SLC25 family protein [Candidatus Bathyarchaeota archaeon]|nr:MC/SLC25 family protein [Candidatus Bathyarchaeota archaeon]